MGEYCITKIIDGLFISDSLVPLVPPYPLRTSPFSAATRSSAHWDGQPTRRHSSPRTMKSSTTSCRKITTM